MTFFIYILVIGVFVFLDQLSKYTIANTLLVGEKIEIISGFFNITHVHNYGAGFSILQNERVILIAAPILAITYLTYLLYKENKKNLLFIISYILIISGAIGNLIDRVKLEYVIDFLDFKIFTYDFPVFNLADSFITVGCAILLLINFKDIKNARN